MKCTRMRLNTRSIFWPSATVCGGAARGAADQRTRKGAVTASRRTFFSVSANAASEAACARQDAAWSTRGGSRASAAARTLSPILTKNVAFASSASRTSVSPRLATASATLRCRAVVGAVSESRSGQARRGRTGCPAPSGFERCTPAWRPAWPPRRSIPGARSSAGTAAQDLRRREGDTRSAAAVQHARATRRDAPLLNTSARSAAFSAALSPGVSRVCSRKSCCASAISRHTASCMLRSEARNCPRSLPRVASACRRDGGGSARKRVTCTG